MHFRGDFFQGQAVNLQALDELVKEQIDANVAEAANPLHSARRCASLREALLAGRVDESLQLLEEVCPAALKDQRLLFRLRKQKFVELLRAGRGDEASVYGSAVVCARTELAPMALDAYPEAYGEFKRLLLLLLHPKMPSTSDAGLLWSQQAKQELADTVFYTVRGLLGVADPTFALLLRYLIYLHNDYQATLPSPLPLNDTLEQLLLPGRDPPPLPVEHYSSASFPEADVQAVRQGTGCSRLEAVDALRHAGGSALQAFKRELARIRLSGESFLDLLLEYASYRGLVDAQQRAQLLQYQQEQLVFPGKAAAAAAAGGADGRGGGKASGGGAAAAKASPSASRHHRPGSDDMDDGDDDDNVRDVDMAGGGGPAGEEGAGAAQEASAAGPGPSGGAEAPANKAPTPSVRQSLQQPGRPDSASPPLKVARRMELASVGCSLVSRLGLEDNAAGGASTSRAAAAAEAEASPSCSGQGGSGSGSASVIMSTEEGLLRLKQLAQDDDVAGVEALTSSLDPDLFAASPELLFDLKRCRYGQLLRAGELNQALNLARSELTPLANDNPALLPLLKGTMSALLPGSDSVEALPTLACVVASIQTALHSRLGVQGPRLIKLMQVLLAAHKAWMKQNKYTDPFQAAIRIDALRAGGTVVFGGAAGTSAAAAAAAAGGGALPLEPGAPGFTLALQGHDELDDDGREDVSMEEEEEGDGGAVDEEGVLRLMEILELPRSTAIELLQANEGDVEASVISFLR